jgi:hypothetical protein
MLDHLSLDVTDYARSKTFYEQALAPLRIRCLMEPFPGIDPDGNNVEAVCHAPEVG